jgi:hypothetical protein
MRSFQATWGEVILRSVDFIPLVTLAKKYYHKYDFYSKYKRIEDETIDDTSSLSSKINNLKLNLPRTNVHKNILFSYVILNETLSKCLLHVSGKLPTIALIPDLFFIKGKRVNNKNALSNFAIENILLPECLKYPELFKFKENCILYVDQNGQKKHKNETNNDGCHIVFLINIKVNKNALDDNNIDNSNINPNELTSNYKWHYIGNKETIELVRERVEYDEALCYIQSFCH